MDNENTYMPYIPCVITPRSYVCFPCIFLYRAHETMGSLQFLSERSAVDRRSQGQFLTLSPRFLSIRSQECAGMCAPTGGHVPLGDTHSNTALKSSSSILFFPSKASMLQSSVPSRRMNVRKQLLCFLPTNGRAGGSEGGGVGETKWREKVDLTREQESRHFLLFFPLGRSLPLSDRVRFHKPLSSSSRLEPDRLRNLPPQMKVQVELEKCV